MRSYNRRQFIKSTGKVGALAACTELIPGLSSCSFFKEPADIAVVNGTDFYNNTLLAVESLGGIQRFVPAGAKVGLLVNSDFEIPGTFVNPDITLAVLKLVAGASPSQIICLQVVKDDYWKRSAFYKTHKEIINRLHQVESNVFPSEFNEIDYVRIDDVPGSLSLKNTEVVKAWLDCDVFINIPIAKHHASTLLTGAMKNIMGVSTRKSNVTFHLGSGKKNNPEHLAQCIADQHLLKKTDLCITDATSFITDNGPSGPGTIASPNKIIAGTDIVAIDAYAATLLGYEPSEIAAVVNGHKAGIGNMNFSEMNMTEINT